MKLILLISAVLGLMLSGCDNYGKKEAPVAETPAVVEPAVQPDIVDEAAQTVERTADAALETAQDAAAEVSATTETVIEETKTVVSGTAGKAASAAQAAVAPAAKVAVAKPVAPATPAVVAPAPKPAAAVVAPAVAPAAVVVPTGDAVAGAAKTGKCKACHTFDAGGSHKVGPNLFGVYGKVAGKTAGFNYSGDLSGASFTWNDAALTAWVCDSKSAIQALTGNTGAKTKMTKQNVCGADATNVAAYLKTLK